jgi:hypothetical protein
MCLVGRGGGWREIAWVKSFEDLFFQFDLLAQLTPFFGLLTKKMLKMTSFGHDDKDEIHFSPFGSRGQTLVGLIHKPLCQFAESSQRTGFGVEEEVYG